MPLYQFDCRECGATARFLLTVAQYKEKDLTCGSCGARLYRAAVPPTSTSVEVRDNGLMARSVETYSNMEEMVKERSRNDPRVQDAKVGSS